MAGEHKNICLIEITNRNFGDAVIAQCTEYMIHNAAKKCRLKDYTVYRYNIYSKDKEYLRQADMIIFAGGGIIKYLYEEFYEHIHRIVMAAMEFGIPVYFNGVGIEGYDQESENCQILKEALNQPVVRGISVRDDVETLTRYYMKNKDIPVVKAVDPAVFVRNAFQMAPHTMNTRKIIGLGIVRHKIFEDNQLPDFTREKQLVFWSDLIREIEARGNRCRLFTNGNHADQDFAIEILAYMGLLEKREQYLFPCPWSATELVQTISRFDGIIAARMHANIIAYTLKIPSVGIIWNQKLRLWGERAGIPKQFLEVEGLTGKIALDTLDKAMIHPKTKEFFWMKRKLMNALTDFIFESALTGKKKTNSPVPREWEKILVATALGGIHGRFMNMNTMEGLKLALDQGFTWYEADLRMTKDRVPVCINGWSEDSYKKLGLSLDCRIPLEDFLRDGVTLEEFKQCHYYRSTFDPLTFEELLFQDWNGKKLILDIGKPNQDTMEAFASLFVTIPKEQKDRVVVRVQRKKDVEYLTSQKIGLELAYYLPDPVTRAEKKINLDSVMELCRKNQIKIITFSSHEHAFTDPDIRKLKKEGFLPCIFSCNSYDRIQNALENGYALIGTSYMDPKTLVSLEG